MSRLLIEGATLLGLADPKDIRPGEDLYAETGTIRATGAEARRLAAAGGEPVQRLDARGQWLLPGCVQAHRHLCQTLLRNGPEDLELLPWLETHVWPGEAAHEAATMGVSARLGLAVRYAGGNVLMDDPATTPENLRAAPEEGLAETERLRAAFHGSENGRLRVAV